MSQRQMQEKTDKKQQSYRRENLMEETSAIAEKTKARDFKAASLQGKTASHLGEGGKGRAGAKLR